MVMVRNFVSKLNSGCSYSYTFLCLKRGLFFVNVLLVRRLVLSACLLVT